MASKAWLLACTALGCSVLATGAYAQSGNAAPAAPPAPAADNAPIVGEVVVTAERREQKLESVPVAVSAFSGKERALLGIESVQDLTDYTPGLSYTSINNRAVIRGIGRNTDNLAVESAVAIYVDDVYDGANAATLLQVDDLFVDRIEVARGPQNTLHGSNSDGGTVSYYSRRPTKYWYFEARGGFANYGKYFGEGLISGPLTDNVRLLIGGNYTNQDGGYFTNLDGPKQGGSVVQGSSGHSEYVEAQIDANISDRLTAWAKVSTGDFLTNYHTTSTLGNLNAYEFGNGGFVPTAFFGLCGLPGGSGSVGCSAATQTVVPGSVVTTGPTALGFPGLNPTNGNIRDFINEFTSTNRMRNDIAIATKWSYHMSNYDITYYGGYQSFNYDLDFDPSSVGAGVSSYQIQGPAALGNLTINPEPSFTLFEENDAFASNELDLTSNFKGPFNYIAGLYWFHQRYNQPTNAGEDPSQTQLASPLSVGTLIAGAASVCPVAGTLDCAGPKNPYSAVSTSITNETYDSYAAFAQGDYKWSDQLKFTVGVRYTEDVKSGIQYWRFEDFDSILTANSFGAFTPALDITPLAIGTSATTAFPGAGVATYNATNGFWQRHFGATWGAVTGNAGFDWTPDPTTLAYFKYSRGYKTGGFNTFVLQNNPETKPEFVDAFEVGAKKTYGRMFQFNAAVYYYNYSNDQIPLNVQNTQGLISSQLFNIPEVTNWGVELEGFWSPITPLTISAQFSHQEATISKSGACFEDTVDPLAVLPGANTAGCLQTSATAIAQNIKGQSLPGVAPNKASVNALYRWRFDPGDLILSGTFIWKDSTYGGVFNRPYDLAPSYTQVNTRLTWTDASNKYSVILYADNIFNRLGYDAITGSELAPAGDPADIVSNRSLTAPRTFGFQVQFRWK